MTKQNIRNRKINNRSRKDQLPYLDLLYDNYQTDYPVNKYDGLSMPTQNISQMAGNTSSPQLTGLQPNSYQAAAKYGTVPQLNKESLGSSFSENFKNMFSTEGLNVLGNAAASVGAGALGTLGGNLISGGKSSGVGNAIGDVGGAIGGAAMMVNPVLGGAVMLGSKLIGGGINALFGSKMNYENINRIENELNQSRNYNSSATNFDELTQEIMSAPSIGYFSKSDIGSDGLFSNKASRKFRELSARKKFVEDWITRSQANSATNLQQNQLNDQLMGWFAYGGLLDINNPYSDGGKIYIKPENRGKFTALKERTGKSATWFKEHGTPAQKKMATFALNSRKWKHNDGGLLNDYSNYVNDTYNSNMEEVSKLFAGGGNLEGNREANTPLGAIVPKEYQNTADLAYAGLEFTPYVGSALGVIDVGNDLYNMYKNRDISLRSVGNLLFDSMGLIPGVKTLSKASDIARALKAEKQANKLAKASSKLNSVSKQGIQQSREGIQKAKKWVKETDKQATNAALSRNKNEMYKSVVNSRESNQFTQGILDAVEQSLNPRWALYNEVQKGGKFANSANDALGLTMGLSDRSIINKKSFGGDLLSNGVEWDNGVTVIQNGGTHENNPYEGVQMGVDSQGIPNLVEEDEVVWNDYVFSNRIPVPNAVRSKYKLRGAKDMTFADAAKKAAKESEERPNDNIAQRGLQDIMSKLAYEQEVIREQRNMNNKNKFKGGGPKYTKQQVGQAAWDAYLSSLKNDDNNILLRRPSASRFYDTTTLKPQDKIPSLQYYNLTRQSNNKTYNNNDDDLLDRDNLLRYAPVVGSAIGLGQTLLSKPNYSRADALAQFAQNAGKVIPISYDPLGNYLTYRPIDIDYIANRMAAQAGATRRNIMNTAGGNRAMALAGLAAQDYSSQLAQAEAIRQANESNFNRGIQVETFNRGTNQYNSETALKAAIANQEARMKASQLGLSGYSTAMQMKDAIDAQRNASISANLTNLFDNLGQIGEEIYDKNRLKWMERKGVLRSDYFDTDKYRKKYGGHINKGGK